MTIKNQNKNVSAENEYIVTDVILTAITDRMSIRDGHLFYITEEEENRFSLDTENGHLIYTSDNENPYHINRNGELSGHLILETEVDEDRPKVLNIRRKNLYNENEIDDFLHITKSSDSSIKAIFDELTDMFNETEEE